MFIEDWLNDKLKEISEKLPTLVHAEPASFSCGYNTGYKQCLLDLEMVIEGGAKIQKNRYNDEYYPRKGICL